MEQSLLTIVLLGIVEGLTEFLPVSSTGHLILAGAILDFDGEASKSFKIAVQLGAILAVTVAYRRKLMEVLVGLAKRDPAAILFARNILIGFAPAIAIGVFAYGSVRSLMGSPVAVSVALIIGGFAILAVERLTKAPRIVRLEEMPLSSAACVGVIQCLAMIPGVSRSGATILGARLIGVDRHAAAEFSFFLAVPTMVAATTYDLYKSRHLLDASHLGDIVVGFGVAFVVALAVLRAFVAVVGRYGFAPFAWYRIAVGSCALLWLYNASPGDVAVDPNLILEDK